MLTLTALEHNVTSPLYRDTEIEQLCNKHGVDRVLAEVLAHAMRTGQTGDLFESVMNLGFVQEELEKAREQGEEDATSQNVAAIQEENDHLMAQVEALRAQIDELKAAAKPKRARARKVGA